MAFATESDVAARLGRDLADNERAIVTYLLPAAQALVAGAAGKSEQWAETLNPVPVLLKILAVEVIVRVLGNPDGVARTSEQLGEYQHSTSFRDASGLLELTPREEQLASSTVNGRSATSRIGSIADDIRPRRHDCPEASCGLDEGGRL